MLLLGLGLVLAVLRGLRTTAIERRPCGPKTLILALMALSPSPQPPALSPSSSAPSPPPQTPILVFFLSRGPFRDSFSL